MVRKHVTFLSALALFSHATYAIRSLKDQAAQAYFITRSLSEIKADLTNNKLNQELQEILVPLVIAKYHKQLEPQFNKLLKSCYSIDFVAFSLDGRYAFIKSRSGKAHLWNIATDQVQDYVYNNHSKLFNKHFRYGIDTVLEL